MNAANGFKSERRFADAVMMYQYATAAAPDWGYPSYQLACTYELWGKHAEAALAFEDAIAIGFDDYPTAKGDEELGEIRKRPDFPQQLEAIRQNYLTFAPTRSGTPVAFKPDRGRGPNGWPLMLLLHGRGDSPTSYFEVARGWAELGYLAVAVPGTESAGEGRYQWSGDSLGGTHASLRAIVDSDLLAGLIDPTQVYLFGFSQGGLHAGLLAIDRPEDYAGAVVISPGGGNLVDRLLDPKIPADTPRRICFIYGEEEKYFPIVTDVWKTACKASNWRFEVMTHPGGHDLPAEWPKFRDAIHELLRTQ